MRPPNKEQLKRMNRRAYVDRERMITKVILGDDEWHIEFKITDAIEAKKKILTGEYELKNVVPAVVDANVLKIRKELLRLSEEIVTIRNQAPKKQGFIKYDKGIVMRTDKIAYEMMNIKTYGLSTEIKNALD